MIISNKEIIQILDQNYFIDPVVFEKILQILSLKILEKSELKDRIGKESYPLAVASAYVGAKLLAKKLRTRLALTQKLVAESKGVEIKSIRVYSALLYNYNFDEIIEEMYGRIVS